MHGLAKQIKASFKYCEAMPTLDIAMPIALFLVLIGTLFLNKRIKGKLESTLGDKKFETRDVIFLVVFMVAAVSSLAYVSMINSGAFFQYAILIFFLFSYTSLLFTVSYVFSNLRRTRAQILSVGFGIAGVVTAIVFLLSPFRDSLTVLRVAAFFGFAVFCFGAAVYEIKKKPLKERWYLAVQPPAIFALLFIFLSILGNSATVAIWQPYVSDVFGLTFAVLIILYLSPLFNWKTVGLFAVLLTSWDIFSVIITPIMITAAHAFTGLTLPVFVYLPNIPIQIGHLANTGASYIVFRGLGLGDFFFAGILTIQTFKKYGQKLAIITAVAIAISFGIWDAFLYDIINGFIPIVGRNIGGLPATMFMVTGWGPVIAVKLWFDRRKHVNVQPSATEPAKDTPQASI